MGPWKGKKVVLTKTLSRPLLLSMTLAHTSSVYGAPKLFLLGGPAAAFIGGEYALRCRPSARGGDAWPFRGAEPMLRGLPPLVTPHSSSSVSGRSAVQGSGIALVESGGEGRLCLEPVDECTEPVEKLTA